MPKMKKTETSTLGPIAALGLSGEGVVGSVVDPERHTKARMEAIKKIMDQANQTPGNASITQTFHSMNVVVLCVSCAHLVALCMLFIVANRTMYTHPYRRDMSAQVSERSAVVRTRGSYAISWFWNMDKIAESSNAETMFSVFHSRRSESMNSSHECLNLTSAGPTFVVFQSSDKGRP